MSFLPPITIKIHHPPLPEPKIEWSLSAYYDKIDAVCSEIISEQENEPCLVLWWGNDGLRLNKDGTTEWTKKIEKKENKEHFLDMRVSSMCNNMAYQFSLYNQSAMDFKLYADGYKSLMNAYNLVTRIDSIDALRM